MRGPAFGLAIPAQLRDTAETPRPKETPVDLSFVTSLSLPLMVVAFAIVTFAGVVKGTVGFAMPLIMISGLSAFMDPKLALAALILPTVASNAVQTFRRGIAQAVETVKDFWRYLIIVCVMIFVAAQGVALIPSQVFFAVLGVPVIVISVMQLVGVRLSIPPAKRLRSQWLFGGISGVIGGLAGTWGPTTVLYLMAIDTPKARQMVVQGVIYGLGSVVLFSAHVQSGILNAQSAPFSALMVVPALIGMQLGFRIQDRLDQKLFRKVTLILLVVGGLNLIRRAIVG